MNVVNFKYEFWSKPASQFGVYHMMVIMEKNAGKYQRIAVDM